MNKIEQLIDYFIEPYKKNDDIQAAILTGSYAQGYQNKYSDIDIFIISSDTLNWRERGNKIIENYMFEYFINPAKVIFKEIDEYKKSGMATALIIANGVEIYDKTGIVKQLKEKAFDVIDNLNNPMNGYEMEMIKYYTNYYFEQLKRAYDDNQFEFMFLYHTYIEYIIYSYGKFNGIILPLKTKIYQYIFNENYFINNNLKKISDNNFLDILKKCMTEFKKDIMYKNITDLKEYFINSIGGFNIDGWKIRSPVK